LLLARALSWNETVQPITAFESQFRAAEVLLKVHRLLRNDATSEQTAQALPRLREAVGSEADEDVILLLNDLFVGLVRENAALRPRYFQPDNMALLLRQAVASACTALGVFLPALLNTYLPKVVQVRQRNFYPREDGEVRTFFLGFTLRLDQIPSLLEDDDAEQRWLTLSRLVLDYCSNQVLANERGIHIVLRLLGVQDPWQQIAQRSGVKEQSLREQTRAIVKRRNDIVHRGDYAQAAEQPRPTAIDLAWTSTHVNAIQSVVLACDALALESVRQLEAGAVAA
jgi:hypothetical protein